eukprot:13662882-Alexandrium_andersonii.AAC.1
MAIGQWVAAFPGTQVAASAARPGPNQGPQGGVALLAPHPYKVRRVAGHIPACCLDVTLERS